MNITVKLYGMLRRYRPKSADGAPHHPFSITIPAESTLSDLIQLLEIKDGAVNGTAVNGQTTDLHTPLQEDDTISLFPPSAGGTN